MTRVPFPREFHYGDRGPDVEAVGRALSRAGFGPRLTLFAAQPKRIRQTWGRGKQKALRKFKIKHHLKADYVYGKTVHKQLSPHFDAYARKLLTQARKPPDPSLTKFNHLLSVMQKMSAATHGYSYGGGHGVRLETIPWDAKLDCSSSTAKALFEAGMWDGHYAMVSGDIAREYGLPGKGKYFTVYANSGHAWIRLQKSRWWRFDTSPWGSGGLGARLRLTPRITYSFQPRHWRGM